MAASLVTTKEVLDIEWLKAIIIVGIALVVVAIILDLAGVLWRYSNLVALLLKEFWRADHNKCLD